MALTFDATQTLFRAGEFAELLRLTDLSRPATRVLGSDHRSLLALVLALIGDVEQARELALTISERDSALVRSEAQVVFGLVAEQEGAISHATEHFQLAVRLATVAADDAQLAWAHLRLFRHMIDGNTNAILPGMLAEVRRAVTRAATPHTSAYLHECVAVLEGQTGRIDEASRHCEIADSLLDNAPNAWLSSGNLLIKASLAALDYQFEEATEHIQRARHYIARSANARASGADSTLGHLQVLTGHFDKAIVSLNRAINTPHPSRFAAMAGLDGLARLYLASDRLDKCNETLDRLDAQTAKDSRLDQFYSIRWARITRARSLLRGGNSEQAVVFLGELERQAGETRDVPFSAALNLVTAQALAVCGRSSEAAARLLAAARLGAPAFRQLQAQYYFASAGVLPRHAVTLRRRLRHRAFTLWRQQGVVSVPLEMRAASRQPSKHAGSSSSNRDGTDTSLVSLVDSIAQLFNLAHSPSVAGSELLSIIQMSGCSARAELVGIDADSPQVEQSSDEMQIHLGREHDRLLKVVCLVPSDPAKAVVLAGIERLAHAALALEHAKQEERRSAALWPAVPVEKSSGGLFISEEMQSLLATARRVASTNVPVLITGETGTGKEVLARTIHGYSTRAKAPFLPFNCTSTPRDMLDSQLFGHRRGSFTGAVDHFPGVIRAAAAGSLFLDEIGDMPLDAQPKLLRFLESGEVHPVGDTQPVRADVRVIAATNANLDSLVTDGRFREDLFYRLNIVRLHLPPLRDRRMEIPTLASHYLDKYAREYDKGDLRLAEETMEYLLLYRWPGNVRQLANEMRRMAALCETGAVLMPEHLSADIAASRRTIPASDRVLDPTEVVVRLDQPLPAAIEHVERAMLQYALKKCGGRMEDTAALLGLSRKGLYLKRHRFGIDPPGTRSSAGAA